jgi:hypothetical protein
LSPNHNYNARVLAQSPDNAPLDYSWDIMEESAAKSVGGDFESSPQRFPGLIPAGASANTAITTPSKPGAYRLFVYALDKHGKGAYANIPFYVDAKLAAVGMQQP